ncbi:hypothetical protein AMECASPLE_021053, partial [Ameca splendens]
VYLYISGKVRKRATSIPLILARPAGAIGPLRRRPRGRTYMFQFASPVFGVVEDTGMHSHPQSIAANHHSPQPFQSLPRAVP